MDLISAIVGMAVVFFGTFLCVFPEVYVMGVFSLFLVSRLGGRGAGKKTVLGLDAGAEG